MKILKHALGHGLAYGLGAILAGVSIGAAAIWALNHFNV